MKLSQSSYDDFHRKNGLTCPLDYPQVLAWFLTAAPMVMFFVFVYPATKTDLTFFFVLPFIILYAIGIVLFVFCTLETHPYPTLLSHEQSHYCKYCNAIVPNSAKHCRACNKCRVGFDHHCRFINNCVSSSNYTYFYFGILCFISAAFISLGGSAYSCVKYISHKEAILDSLTNYLKQEITATIFWILLGLTVVIDLSLSIPLGVLISYHIFFQANNITTYDFILKASENYPQELERFACLPPNRKGKVTSYKTLE